MTRQSRRYRWFQIKMLMLYPLGWLAMCYFRTIAPYFGPAHVARMRQALPRRICSAFLWLNGIEVTVAGQQHLLQAAPAPRVLAINHNSRFDGYILLSMFPAAFKSFWSNAAHVTTEKFGLIERFGTLFDLFFVHDKGDLRRTLREFKKAEAYLATGATLSFFPEGGFSPDGLVRGIGASCIALAVRTGANIVPLVFVGTKSTFERRQDRPAPVRVVVLEPIPTVGKTKQDIPGLVEEIERRMNEELLRH